MIDLLLSSKYRIRCFSTSTVDAEFLQNYTGIRTDDYHPQSVARRRALSEYSMASVLIAYGVYVASGTLKRSELTGGSETV